MRKLGVIALGLLACFVAWWIPVFHPKYSCVVCRLYRFDSTCFGLTRSRYAETDCSRWYAENVEPEHAHIWERGVCVYSTNLFGQPLEVGCSPGHFPIMMLQPTTQMRVYQHFQDPQAAKRLFANLTDEKTHNDRLDEEDVDRGHLIVDALRRWEDAGFSGSWDEWWDRFYAKHVEEHNEWLTWMNSDSGMNFQDWRKQKQPAD